MKAYSVVILLLLQVLIYLSASFVFCKHALLMFQQNRYELYRYSKWLFNRRNIYFNPSYIYAALGGERAPLTLTRGDDMPTAIK